MNGLYSNARKVGREMKIKCPNCGRKSFSLWRKAFVGTRYSAMRALIGHAICFDCNAKLVYSTAEYFLFSTITGLFTLWAIVSGLNFFAAYLPQGLSFGLLLFFFLGFSAFVGFVTSNLFWYFMPLSVLDENKPEL